MSAFNRVLLQILNERNGNFIYPIISKLLQDLELGKHLFSTFSYVYLEMVMTKMSGTFRSFFAQSQ